MKTTFIYPYKQSSAQGTELLYSIRSLCENFNGEHNIIVVGDKPEWASDELTVITGDFDKHAQPAINVAKKLDAVIRNQRIPANFVWMNDDIYFVNKVDIEDIIKLKHLGEYNPAKNFKQLGNPYHVNARKTLKWLKEHDKQNYMYTTHLPFFYNKSNWKKIFALLPLTEEPYLLTNLYHNYFFDGKDGLRINHKNEISVGCYRMLNKAEAPLLTTLLNKTKFFNHSQTGFCSVVSEELHRRFKAIKCKYEL